MNKSDQGLSLWNQRRANRWAGDHSRADVDRMSDATEERLMLHRGLHVFSLKRYCVTVMDNWTSQRFFWTLAGAHKFYCRHESCANVYKWIDGKWQLIIAADGGRDMARKN